MRKLFSDFREFLKDYKVMSLAVAFVIGAASIALIQSLVNNIIMPLVTPFIPSGAWATAAWDIWKFHISWGPFLSALINFVIIAWVVFIIAKFVIREEKVAKK